MKRDEIPDLITEEAKRWIKTLATQIETGVQAGTMDRPDIAEKTTAMIADIFESWKDSVFPNDLVDPDKYPTPPNGNPIDTFLQQEE